MIDNSEVLAFAPPHPGEYLREDILPQLNMPLKDLAEHLGVSRPTLSKLVNEKADMSTKMAIRLGQAFRNGARFWLALQLQYDLWQEQNKDCIEVSPLDWDAVGAA